MRTPIILILTILGLASAAQINAQISPKPAEAPQKQKARSAVTLPKASPLATLILMADMDCSVMINGGPVVEVIAQKPFTVAVAPGDNVIEVLSRPDTLDRITLVETFLRNQQKVVKLELLPLQLERRKAESVAAERQRFAQLFEQDMAYIEEGICNRGCSGNDCPSDRKPRHAFTLSAFHISKYELTQEQWLAVMGELPEDQMPGCSRCPVTNVSWEDVQQFLAQLNERTGMNYRLPTEAEWEFAGSRGGGSIQDMAWEEGGLHIVGGKRPNAKELYDVIGNALEWCADWYSTDYYANSPARDPQGPPMGVQRVRRGNLSVAHRGVGYPNERNPFTGFRLTRTP